MPRGNGTGPMGFGPMTGRGAGYCISNAVTGFAGYGRAGTGRGFRRMYAATGAPGWARGVYAGPYQYGSYDEKDMLREQEEYLAMQLKQVADRLKQLDEE